MDEHLNALNQAPLVDADEEILTYTVSDDALEAAAGGREQINSLPAMACLSVPTLNCCPH